MRLSTIMVLLTVISLVLSAFGLWSFYRSFEPIPTNLHTFTGTANSVRTVTGRYTRSNATFQLTQPNGESIEFSYTPLFKRFYYFAEHLKNGIPVEITIGPGGVHDIWGIKLDSQALMTPIEARETRMADGRWGLAFFVGFLVTLVWAARRSQDFRRRGI